MRQFLVVIIAALAAASECKMYGASEATVPEGSPVIDNRQPLSTEIGYHPLPGETAALNPPSFIWLQEGKARTYEMQWSRNEDFTAAESAGPLPFNTYTPSTAWAPGHYYWRYRYVTPDGLTSGWSCPRDVIIPENATEFPMPDRAEQRRRVPAAHPRLFLRPEELPRLRELAQGRESTAFESLRALADRFIQAGPTAEPTYRGTASNLQDKEALKYWWPNALAANQAATEAELISFVYLITQDEKYAEAARRWILHLAAWDPDGPTNWSLNTEAAKPLLFRLPRAYDWAYDALTPEDRQIVQKIMLRRARDAWESSEVKRGSGHLNSPYDSHGNRTWHMLGECGIAFLGEIPEAEDWLDYALNKFFAAYPVWAGQDGGWHEGFAYWSSYMSRVVWWLQVMKSALQIDGFNKPFFSTVGDFPLYVVPPYSPNSGFGDQSEAPPGANLGTTIEYFSREAGARPASAKAAAHWEWWKEQWRLNPASGVLGFLYSANLPPIPSPALPPTDIPPSRVFEGIGVASLHNTLLDSRDDVHFLFKSSPFGSMSHGHNPQNSFQLNAYGEALLTTCVFRDTYGSPFHLQWAQSTRAHNAVLVNGQGQTPRNESENGALSRGKIIDSRLTPEWDYLCGDAAEAYGGRLSRYYRRVVFVRPDLFLIYDDLVAKKPATFQFMLHAYQPFILDEAAKSFSVQQPQAVLTGRYLTAEPLSFRQWDGYDPKPELRDPKMVIPNQWHLEASTTERRLETGMLTVLVASRAGEVSDWKAERLESNTAVGIRFQRAGQETVILLRKTGVQGEAEAAGIRFTENVFVETNHPAAAESVPGTAAPEPASQTPR